MDKFLSSGKWLQTRGHRDQQDFSYSPDLFSQKWTKIKQDCSKCDCLGFHDSSCCLDGSLSFILTNVALVYRLGLIQNLKMISVAKMRQKILYHEKPLNFGSVPPKPINFTSEHICIKKILCFHSSQLKIAVAVSYNTLNQRGVRSGLTDIINITLWWKISALGQSGEQWKKWIYHTFLVVFSLLSL